MYKKYFFTLITFITLCFSISASPTPDINAEGAILIEPKTNTILFSKNMNENFFPASTTKILTSLILLEDLPPDTLITKTQDAIDHVPSDSSHIGLKAGDHYTAFEGLHAILLASDNFVSYDMAKKDAGSIEAFAKKMNQKAKLLGATSSHFVNPHGYHDANHFTTPYDLSQIAKTAFSNPMLLTISGTYQHPFTLKNTPDKILLQHTASLLDPQSPLYNPHVVAAKTGFHNEAKRTLVAKATFNNIELIGVVMHTDAPLQFQDMNALFAFGEKNYSLIDGPNDLSYITNHSYSPWAKPYIDLALSKGWITHTTRNYSDYITKREMINLIRSALPAAYRDLLSTSIHYNGDSIYKENLPALGNDMKQVCYDLFAQLQLVPHDITPLEKTIPSPLNETIKKLFNFLVDTRTLGQTEHFLQDDTYLTYEQAIAITSRLHQVVSSYDTFKLVAPKYPYFLPVRSFY